MEQPSHQVSNMLLHPQKYLKSKNYPQRVKKLHQNKLLKCVMPKKAAALAHETATTSSEEHVASPPKV